MPRRREAQAAAQAAPPFIAVCHKGALRLAGAEEDVVAGIAEAGRGGQHARLESESKVRRGVAAGMEGAHPRLEQREDLHGNSPGRATGRTDPVRARRARLSALRAALRSGPFGTAMQAVRFMPSCRAMLTGASLIPRIGHR
ncbi:hypothetical protein D3C72_1495900 [compost metagenome]